MSLPGPRGGRVTSKYVPDNASMAAFLISPRVRDLVTDVGGEIAGKARANAIESGAVDTGDYASGFKVEAEIVSVVTRPGLDSEPGSASAIEGGPRWAGKVVNDDDAAAANEYGNRNTPERRPLRRAAEPYHVPRIIGKW